MQLHERSDACDVSCLDILRPRRWQESLSGQLVSGSPESAVVMHYIEVSAKVRFGRSLKDDLTQSDGVRAACHVRCSCGPIRYVVLGLAIYDAYGILVAQRGGTQS